MRACSRSPGANFDAQPALVEYFVILMRVRPYIIGEYTRTREPAGARPGTQVERADLARDLGVRYSTTAHWWFHARFFWGR